MLEDLINQQWQALARLIRESKRLGQSKLKALIARKMRRQKPSLVDAIGKRRKANALEEYRRRFASAPVEAIPAPAPLRAAAQGFREPPLEPLRPRLLCEPPKPRPRLEAPKPRPQLEPLKPQQQLEALKPQAAAEAPWVPAEAPWAPVETSQPQPEAPWLPVEIPQPQPEAQWVQPLPQPETPWVPTEAPWVPAETSQPQPEAPWVQPLPQPEAPWVPAEAPWAPAETPQPQPEAPWVQPLPQPEAPDPRPQLELLKPQPPLEGAKQQPPFEAPQPQPPLEAPKQRAPLDSPKLPERVQNAERQRRRTKAANQNKRQEPASTSSLSHRFNEALNNLPPSLAHDLGVLKRHKNEVFAAAAACALVFGGAHLYRSMNADRNKPVQVTHAAPPPRSEPEKTVEERRKTPAVPNKKLYYDRLPPSEAAEPASEAPASPATAATATAATTATATASLAELPKETAPAAPEKTAEPAQAKVEAAQPANAPATASPVEPPKETALAAPQKTAEPAQAEAEAGQPANAPAAPAPAAAEGPIADRPTWVRAERYLPDGTRTDTLRPAAAPLGEGEARKPVLAATAPQPPAAEEAPKRMESVAAAPALAQAPAEPASPPPGGYFVQVKSDQSRKAAEAELAAVAEKHKSVLGQMPLTIRSADLKDRGTWFRVLIGPVKSHDDADNLCKRLKGAGLQDCIVQKLD